MTFGPHPDRSERRSPAWTDWQLPDHLVFERATPDRRERTRARTLLVLPLVRQRLGRHTRHRGAANAAQASAPARVRRDRPRGCLARVRAHPASAHARAVRATRRRARCFCRQRCHDLEGAHRRRWRGPGRVPRDGGASAPHRGRPPMDAQ
ncbi:hypothetical protein PsYK624_098220 [Phanerochaete sordida]|uniref:Uncharacterized protein n=1 Tax=Phanerochaete sordida TaxID=48140 RepID=A0A9P3GF45_9APHY|nr:hypothetical protein PsYK624_098220 [Phanerochaete sordida]